MKFWIVAFPVATLAAGCLISPGAAHKASADGGVVCTIPNPGDAVLPGLNEPDCEGGGEPDLALHQPAGDRRRGCGVSGRRGRLLRDHFGFRRLQPVLSSTSAATGEQQCATMAGIWTAAPRQATRARPIDSKERRAVARASPKEKRAIVQKAQNRTLGPSRPCRAVRREVGCVHAGARGGATGIATARLRTSRCLLPTRKGHYPSLMRPRDAAGCRSSVRGNLAFSSVCSRPGGRFFCLSCLSTVRRFMPRAARPLALGSILAVAACSGPPGGASDRPSGSSSGEQGSGGTSSSSGGASASGDAGDLRGVDASNDTLSMDATVEDGGTVRGGDAATSVAASLDGADRSRVRPTRRAAPTGPVRGCSSTPRSPPTRPLTAVSLSSTRTERSLA